MPPGAALAAALLPLAGFLASALGAGAGAGSGAGATAGSGAAAGAAAGRSTSDTELAAPAALCRPDITVSAALSLKALATSPMLKFMPFRVASVIFCTSCAWMVALSATAFWSSQNCTALSSSMRFSRSSTLSVGATQLDMLGSWGILPVAPFTALLARFCRKSKPGTNLPKPKFALSLMSAPYGYGVSAFSSLPQCAAQAKQGQTFRFRRAMTQ